VRRARGPSCQQGSLRDDTGAVGAVVLAAEAVGGALGVMAAMARAAAVLLDVLAAAVAVLSAGMHTGCRRHTCRRSRPMRYLRRKRASTAA